MRFFRLLLAVSLILPGLCYSEAAKTYRIYGDVKAVVTDGEAVLFKSGSTIGAKIDVARGPIINGRFSLTGVVGELGKVTVSIRDAKGDAKISTPLILEPEEVEVVYQGPITGLETRGGHYNELVISSWQNSQKYRGLVDEYSTVMEAKKHLDDGDKKRTLHARAVELYHELKSIRLDALKKIAYSNDDPMASLLAVLMGAPAGKARTDELEKILGPHSGLAAMQAVSAQAAAMMNTSQAIKVGSQIKNFSANNLGGEPFQLADVLKQNKYVLVEFWASWCAPCRAEIPHIKEAYEAFHSKGFDVVSFSLDDDHEAWSEASEEEQLPWINTSDGQAYSSPVTKLYGVTVIPQNYLVDKDGKIVALNLRGDKLAEKLSELFGDR